MRTVCRNARKCEIIWGAGGKIFIDFLSQKNFSPIISLGEWHVAIRRTRTKHGGEKCVTKEKRLGRYLVR